MTENRTTRYRRLATTVPIMLGATALGLMALPAAVIGLALSDVVRGKPRLPRLRVFLFALQYGINDSVEILLAPLLWAQAGFGTGLDSAASLTRHRRLQWWSLELLTRRAEQLLGLTVEIDERDRAALTPGPVVVIARHASLFDASLPALLYGRQGLAVRGVVMAELLADPGFDLIYGRLGSVFVPRDDGPAAIESIRTMTESARRVDGADTVIGIFPEGRLFRPHVRDRLLGRLAEKDRERADQLAGLTHLLPPRPTGLRTILAALPDAELVVLDHRGLDDLGSLTALADRAPLGRTVTVTARRYRRAELPDPSDPAAFASWLDDLWLDLDRRLGHGRIDGEN